MLVDTIGPRLTASPAHKRAAEFMRDTATKYGLTNARLEPFEFGRGWELDKLTIEMVEPRYMPLLGYAEAWSPSTSGELVVSAVSVAGKSADDVRAMAAQLKGAAVLQAADRHATSSRPIASQPTSQPDPAPAPAAAGRRAWRRQPAGGRRQRPAGRRANTEGSAGRGRGRVAQAQPRHAGHGVRAGGQPREHDGHAAEDRPRRRALQSSSPAARSNTLSVKLRVNVQSRFLDDRQTYNVLAEIPGTDPALKTQIVMLGAHLDSWHAGTGATDNADGAVVALEAFRILKAIGAAPKRTLRLALWSGEEEGLLGSKAYVRDHLDGDAHKADRDRMDVYFNIDPGKGPIYGWYLENNEAVRPIFDAWLAPFKDLGAVRNVPQGIGNTDHLSFIAAGVPGFNPIQDYVDYDIRLHHTNADTSERVDLQDLKQNAVIIASFLYHAANRAEMIPTTIRK